MTITPYVVIRDMSYLAHALSIEIPDPDELREVMMELCQPQDSWLDVTSIKCNMYNCIMMIYMRLDESSASYTKVKEYVKDSLSKSGGDRKILVSNIRSHLWKICGLGGNEHSKRIKLFVSSLGICWFYYSHEASLFF
jgi:hypothetical protein